MDATAIATVAAAVVALTTLIKWSGLPDSRGPIVVLLASALGVAIWAYSRMTPTRAVIFDLFAAWITVATSAAGVFGFTRSMPDAITATQKPPAGAGANPTTKMED